MADSLRSDDRFKPRPIGQKIYICKPKAGLAEIHLVVPSKKKDDLSQDGIQHYQRFDLKVHADIEPSDVWLAIEEYPRGTRNAPLGWQAETTQLLEQSFHRILAKTKPEPTLIKNLFFFNGNLLGDLRTPSKGEGRFPGRGFLVVGKNLIKIAVYERLSNWIRAILRMKTLTSAWDMASGGKGPVNLGDCFKVSKSREFLSFGLHVRWNGKEFLFEGVGGTASIDDPYRFDLTRKIRLRKNARVSEALSRAFIREFVAQEINEYCARAMPERHSSIFPRVVFLKDRPVFELGTNSLLGAAYLQFLWEIVEPQKKKVCEECGKIFEYKRKTARFCSGTCKSNWNQKKQRKAKGRTK
jgi:hypothetical protein